MAERNIVIIGAGVAGLTTALLLSRISRYNVTVAAKHMPGDYDIEYASPWAGANFMPQASKGTKTANRERNSWKPFEILAQKHPDAGVHFQKAVHLRRNEDAGAAKDGELFSSNPWFHDVFPDFENNSESELRAGYDKATSYTSVCINTAIYLPWLVSQCLRNGVVFKRAIFKHVCDAARISVHHSGKSADLVVNCTGLSASKLGGVEDKTVVPARGQIVVVRNDAGAMYGTSGTDDADDEMCYTMTRAAGGGTVLGGCYQLGNWESQPDPSLAIRIMKRAVEICPALTGGQGIEHLDIIRHGVGLRPVREGGARIERELINGVQVVHFYGQGGAGYQSSYGCAEEAIGLINEALVHTRANL